MAHGPLEDQNRALTEEIRQINVRHEEAMSVLKQAERKLVEALAEAEESNRCKSQLIAEVNHEIRTPLNAILGFSKLLLQDEMGPKAKARAAAIHDASLYLLELVDDLSCEDETEIKPDIQTADVPQLLNSCMPLVEEQARKAGVALNLDIAPDFPAIRTDPRRLKQVVLNIVGNAIKFTRRGGSVTVKAFTRPEEGAFILVISDTGIGIKADQVEAAMTAPDGMDAARRRKGLGLPITKRIVESLGGTLAFESKAGEGTTVTLHFPNAIADSP